MVPYPTNEPQLVSKDFNTGYSAVNAPYINNQSLHVALNTVLDGSQGVLAADGKMHFTSTRLGTWAKGFGGFGRSNGDNVSDYGGVLGYGARAGRHWVLGVALSGSGTDTSSAYQRVNGHSFGGFAYGIYTHGHLRISGDLGGGVLTADSARDLLPTSLVANGSTQGIFLGTGIQMQYLVPLDHAFLIPYGRMTYLHTALSAYTEHGAGLLDLQLGREATNIGDLTLGLRAGVDLHAQGLTWVPWVSAGGSANVGTLHLNVLQKVGLAGANENIARTLVAPAGAFDPGLGLTVQGHGPWIAKFAWQGQYAGNTHYNTFDLIARYQW